jgi:hypothetical protein
MFQEQNKEKEFNMRHVFKRMQTCNKCKFIWMSLSKGDIIDVDGYALLGKE